MCDCNISRQIWYNYIPSNEQPVFSNLFLMWTLSLLSAVSIPKSGEYLERAPQLQQSKQFERQYTVKRQEQDAKKEFATMDSLRKVWSCLLLLLFILVVVTAIFCRHLHYCQRHCTYFSQPYYNSVLFPFFLFLLYLLVVFIFFVFFYRPLIPAPVHVCFCPQLIESALQQELPADLLSALSNGVVLCNLVNQLRPNTISVIYTPPHRERSGGEGSLKVSSYWLSCACESEWISASAMLNGCWAWKKNTSASTFAVFTIHASYNLPWRFVATVSEQLCVPCPKRSSTGRDQAACRGAW